MRVLQIQSYNFDYQEPMYESQQGSPMNNYSDINPYIMIYYSMNIKIHEDITREAAENVVKQIGYMHNAIGHVFKDLTKILSYKFPQPPYTQQSVNQHRKQSINTKNDLPKPMEIQESEVQSKPISKPRIVQKQKFIYEKPVEQSKRIQKIQKIIQESIIQGGNNDIFGEFAYNRQQEEGKNGGKNLDIKSSIAKIVQQKINKKKKDVKKGQVIEKKKSNGYKQKQQNFQTSKYQLENNQRQFNSSKLHQLKNVLNSNIIQHKPENDIFSEFQYEHVHNSPQRNQAVAQEDVHLRKDAQDQVQQIQAEPQNNMPQNQGSYWNYYKQKPEPNVYEISDDD